MAIAVGIWMLVLQNLGVIPVAQKVSGNVDIDNTVDINLQEINGRSDVFFNNPMRGDDDKYYRIPVTTE